MYKIFAADARCPRDGRHLEVRPLDPGCVVRRGTVVVGLSGVCWPSRSLVPSRSHIRSLSSRCQVLGYYDAIPEKDGACPRSMLC